MNGEVYDYTKFGSEPAPPAPPARPSEPKAPKPGKRKAISCAGCSVAILVLCFVIALVAGLVVGLPALMKSNDAYQEGLARAQADPRVREILGEPVVDGWMPTGSVNTNGDTGSVSLSVGIRGPKGSGTLHIEATKSAGVWTYQVLGVRLSEGSEIKYIDLRGGQLGFATPRNPGRVR